MRSCRCVLEEGNNVSVYYVWEYGSNKPCEEIPEVHELAMTLVLNVNDSPSVLAPTDCLSVNENVAFRTNNGERNHVLNRQLAN